MWLALFFEGNVAGVAKGSEGINVAGFVRAPGAPDQTALGAPAPSVRQTRSPTFCARNRTRRCARPPGAPPCHNESPDASALGPLGGAGGTGRTGFGRAHVFERPGGFGTPDLPARQARPAGATFSMECSGSSAASVQVRRCGQPTESSCGAYDRPVGSVTISGVRANMEQNNLVLRGRIVASVWGAW